MDSAIEWMLLSLIPPAIAAAAALVYGLMVSVVVAVVGVWRRELRVRDVPGTLALGPVMMLIHALPFVALLWVPALVAAASLGIRLASCEIQASAVFALVGLASLALSRHNWLWADDTWWETLHLEVSVVLIALAVVDQLFRRIYDPRRGAPSGALE